MTEIRMSDEQLHDLAAAIVKEQGKTDHHCRFDEIEARNMHQFSRMMQDGGEERFREVLALGERLIALRKAGLVAIASGVVGCVGWAIWRGIVSALGGHSE